MHTVGRRGDGLSGYRVRLQTTHDSRSAATPIHRSLQALSPRWTFFWGLLLWLVARASIYFVDFGVADTQAPYLILAAYGGAFFAGTVMISVARRSANSANQPRLSFYASPDRINLIALVLLGASLVFVALRLFDIVYVRGLIDVGSVQELRNLDNTIVGDDRTTGGIGLISGLGYPLAIPALVFAVYYRRQLTLAARMLGSLLFCAYTLYVLASGSRYILVVLVMLTGVSKILSDGRIRIGMGSRSATALALAGLFSLMTYSTIQRDIIFGAQSREAALAAAPDRKLFTVSNQFITWFANQNPTAQDVMYGGIEVSWYITHGVYEFTRIWSVADPSDRSWGGAQFATALYLLRIMGVETLSEDIWRRNLATYGFYSTFFGPVYLDFGLDIGFVYCFLLGAVAQLLWLAAIRGSLSGIMLYPFTWSVIFGMWVNNYLLAGLGTPILGLTLVAILIAKSVQPSAPRIAIPPVEQRRRVWQ